MLRKTWRVAVGVALASGAVAAPGGAAAASDPPLALTYDKPASRWTEALPVGNGRIGAMVFGGTEDERLQVNEGSLRGGSPHSYADPEAHTRLEEIRRLIFAGRVAEAEKLSEGLMGRPKLLMPSQPFCDLRMRIPGHREAAAYSRQLRLDDAIVETSYAVGPTTFRREVFVQSTADEIRVLPALPRQWPSGSLKGVRVRGGGQVDITWSDGRLAGLRLQSDRARACRVSYGTQSVEVRVGPGKPAALYGSLQRVTR